MSLRACSEHLCYQPAVRIGPYCQRPLCRRHLLAACREHYRLTCAKSVAVAPPATPQSPPPPYSPQPTAEKISHPSAPKVPSASASFSISLDCLVQWLTACNNSDGYLGNQEGWVVPVESAAPGAMPAGYTALPRPAIYTAVMGKHVDHMIVTSVNGSGRQLRCRCQAVNFQRPVCGLLCQDKRLYIAQPFAIAVTDLSGRCLYRIPADASLSPNPSAAQQDAAVTFSGIGLNSAQLFAKLVISRRSYVAIFCASTGQLRKRVDMVLLDAASTESCPAVGPIFFINQSRTRVISVCERTGLPLGLYPKTPTSGFDKFGHAACATVDSRGHLFVADSGRDAVYAMASDGTVLRTYGRADPLSSLRCPRGLVIARVPADGAADGATDVLIVADWGHRRLLVFDL